MTVTDQITIVKRIAKAWKQKEEIANNYPNSKNEIKEESAMLTYRYALEMCGLTLNEIIALGEADDLDIAVKNLFEKAIYDAS